jgi:hypothetical protein
MHMIMYRIREFLGNFREYRGERVVQTIVGGVDKPATATVVLKFKESTSAAAAQ